MPPPKTKKELQEFLCVINYLGKFSPRTGEVCESLRKLMSAKAFEDAKAIIKEDACMKFYNETKPLYIGTDVSGVGLGAALLQTGDNMSYQRDEAPDNSILRSSTFARKSLTGGEKRYSNIKREALGIL